MICSCYSRACATVPAYYTTRLQDVCVGSDYIHFTSMPTSAAKSTTRIGVNTGSVAATKTGLVALGGGTSVPSKGAAWGKGVNTVRAGFAAVIGLITVL